jgi:hypothetical protein
MKGCLHAHATDLRHQTCDKKMVSILRCRARACSPIQHFKHTPMLPSSSEARSGQSSTMLCSVCLSRPHALKHLECIWRKKSETKLPCSCAAGAAHGEHATHTATYSCRSKLTPPRARGATLPPQSSTAHPPPVHSIIATSKPLHQMPGFSATSSKWHHRCPSQHRVPRPAGGRPAFIALRFGYAHTDTVALANTVSVFGGKYLSILEAS